MERSFLEPHKYVHNEKRGMSQIDLNKSEEYRLLEALGTPKVFYALKANKYFKDPQATKEYSEQEINDLGLPLPIAIETARNKLIKEMTSKGEMPDLITVYRATAPSKIDPPARVSGKLANISAEDQMINRINRSTIGK